MSVERKSLPSYPALQLTTSVGFESCLVDVSDIFYSFLLGEGEGGV